VRETNAGLQTKYGQLETMYDEKLEKKEALANFSAKIENSIQRASK
jgi:hypothetical protein